MHQSGRWDELDLLLDRLLDGLYTDADVARLNELLAADWDACRHYVAYLEVHNRLALCDAIREGDTREGDTIEFSTGERMLAARAGTAGGGEPPASRQLADLPPPVADFGRRLPRLVCSCAPWPWLTRSPQCSLVSVLRLRGRGTRLIGRCAGRPNWPSAGHAALVPGPAAGGTGSATGGTGSASGPRTRRVALAQPVARRRVALAQPVVRRRVALARPVVRQRVALARPVVRRRPRWTAPS